MFKHSENLNSLRHEMTMQRLLQLKPLCFLHGTYLALALVLAFAGPSHFALGQEKPSIESDQTLETETESEKSQGISETQEAEKTAESTLEAEVATDSELDMLTDDSEARGENAPSDTINRPDFTLKDDKPIYETTNPQWLFKAPTIENNSLVLYVGGELCSTQEECKQKQAEAILAELAKYLDEQVLQSQGAALETPLRNLMQNYKIEESNLFATVRTSEGTFYQLWTKVNFDAALLREVKKTYLVGQQPGRIRIVGLSLIPIMGGLLAIHLGAGFVTRKSKVPKNL